METVNKIVHDTRFWVALVTAVVIALKTAIPTLPLDEATLSTMFLTAIFAIFGITAVQVAVKLAADANAENLKLFAKTIADMQKMHQNDMQVLYSKFVK